MCWRPGLRAGLRPGSLQRSPDSLNGLREPISKGRAGLVRLLLVSPASSAEDERSFSALHRLKTWLRSTQQRLNSLAVCHVRQELVDLVDANALTEEFVSRNDKRVSVHIWQMIIKCMMLYAAIK